MRPRTPCRRAIRIDAPSGPCRPLRSRLWPVMVLVMQTDAPFWDSLVFDGIDDVDVEAVTAAFGTVEVAARGRAVAVLRAGRPAGLKVTLVSVPSVPSHECCYGKEARAAGLGLAVCALAQSTGASRRSIRYYEQQGLLESQRTGKGWRAEVLRRAEEASAQRCEPLAQRCRFAPGHRRRGARRGDERPPGRSVPLHVLTESQIHVVRFVSVTVISSHTEP